MKHILNITDFNSRFKWKNDGFRSLYESIIHPAIITCLEALKKYNKSNGVLIGGVALSYYLKPRETQDLDLIFLSEDEIPTYINTFKKTRPHAFLHLETQIEVEVLTSDFIKINNDIVKQTFKNCRIVDGIKVASPVDLIALKLKRFNRRDQMDIEELMEYCIENKITINFDDYNLSDEQLSNYNSIKIDTKFYENAYFLECDYSLNYNKYDIIETENFDIYIFKENVDEPRFNIISKDKMTRYCLDMETNEILDSSTDYKSFLLNDDLYKHVNKYLKEDRHEYRGTTSI